VRSSLTGGPGRPDPTDREAQVLEMLADGDDAGGIARQLGLSTKTVQNHISRILAKFRARDRVDLIFKVRGLDRG
jgi:DNA-binding NarL/FixJ family response regulator